VTTVECLTCLNNAVKPATISSRHARQAGVGKTPRSDRWAVNICNSALHACALRQRRCCLALSIFAPPQQPSAVCRQPPLSGRRLAASAALPLSFHALVLIFLPDGTARRQRRMAGVRTRCILPPHPSTTLVSSTRRLNDIRRISLCCAISLECLILMNAGAHRVVTPRRHKRIFSI